MESATLISSLSLGISALTAWFTIFRRGAVRMTQPAFIFFGPDGGRGKPKVAMCAHLYTTSQRGAIVEGMFVRLTRAKVVQDFDVWVYGQDGLARGSGVYVGQTGVTCSHHFLLPRGGDVGFEFLPGDYTVEIFGKVVGRAGVQLFWRLQLSLTTPIHETGEGVFFDWRPMLNQYEPHADKYQDRTERGMAMLADLLTMKTPLHQPDMTNHTSAPNR